MGNILHSNGMSDLMKNIFDKIKGKIKKDNYKNKYNFSKKHTTNR